MFIKSGWNNGKIWTYITREPTLHVHYTWTFEVLNLHYPQTENNTSAEKHSQSLEFDYVSVGTSARKQNNLQILLTGVWKTLHNLKWQITQNVPQFSKCSSGSRVGKTVKYLLGRRVLGCYLSIFVDFICGHTTRSRNFTWKQYVSLQLYMKTIRLSSTLITVTAVAILSTLVIFI